MMQRILGVFLVAVAFVGLSACKGGADVPEPWAKMRLPIGDGDVTPGSNATNLFVKSGDGGEAAAVKGFEGDTKAMAAHGCKADAPTSLDGTCSPDPCVGALVGAACGDDTGGPDDKKCSCPSDCS